MIVLFYNVTKAPNGRERFVFLTEKFVNARTSRFATSEMAEWLDANVGTNWFYMSLYRMGFDDVPNWHPTALVILDQANATMFRMSEYCAGIYDPTKDQEPVF